MGKYKCNRCGYTTNHSAIFKRHLNRKYDCDSTRLHGNSNKSEDEKSTYCEICAKNFSREDSLLRHNKTYHVESNSNKNISNNKKILKNSNDNNINGDNNNNANGDNNNVNNNNANNNVNSNNVNNNNVNVNVHIYNYLYNNINDLTLFEQYVSLTSPESPYRVLLNNLNLHPNKPKYHNIYVPDPNKSTIDVHNGKKWVTEIMFDALYCFVDTQQLMFRLIFNRFKFFLGEKAIFRVPRELFYENPITKRYHKKIVNHIKVHLYSNKNRDEMPNSCTIPTDPSDEIWWALSKQFTWPEVCSIITKIDKLEIDFDQLPEDFYADLIEKIENKPKLKKFFKKFTKRIDMILEQYDVDAPFINTTPDSSSAQTSDSLSNISFDNSQSTKEIMSIDDITLDNSNDNFQSAEIVSDDDISIDDSNEENNTKSHDSNTNSESSFDCLKSKPKTKPKSKRQRKN